MTAKKESDGDEREIGAGETAEVKDGGGSSAQRQERRPGGVPRRPEGSVQMREKGCAADISQI
ncbi:hypothetical protein Hanom_Chr15g01390651 [Helianthus anomalus]